MVNYLLHRTSILRHFSLQHFTSVVISLQTFIWHRACQYTLDKSHCYFVCFHTPEWKEKAENGLIFYFQQLFLLLRAGTQQVCLSLSAFSVKVNQVSVSCCVLTRYSAFIKLASAIKHALHLNDSVFPPKARDRLLLVRPPLCLLSRCLFDWVTGWRCFCCVRLSVSLSSCLPDRLSARSHICRCLLQRGDSRCSLNQGYRVFM